MVDFASAVRRFGGDRSLYGEVALLFASVCPASIEELEQAVEAHDWKKAALVAHRLRGGFATVGEDDLGLLALWIETSCGKCELSELRSALQELKDGGAVLVSELKQYTQAASR